MSHMADADDFGDYGRNVVSNDNALVARGYARLGTPARLDRWMTRRNCVWCACIAGALLGPLLVLIWCGGDADLVRHFGGLR